MVGNCRRELSDGEQPDICLTPQGNTQHQQGGRAGAVPARTPCGRTDDRRAAADSIQMRVSRTSWVALRRSGSDVHGDRGLTALAPGGTKVGTCAAQVYILRQTVICIHLLQFDKLLFCLSVAFDLDFSR